MICGCLSACFVGCAQMNRSSSFRPPVFFEGEIRSKSWTDSEGRRLQLVDWSVVDLQEQGEMLIAKFGDTNSELATCLEFYRVCREPEGFFLVQREKTPESDSTFSMEKKLVPERVLYLLLERDPKPGMVKSVETNRQQGKSYFTVVRETIPETPKKRQGLRYTLIYDKDLAMHQDLSVWSWDISD